MEVGQYKYYRSNQREWGAGEEVGGAAQVVGLAGKGVREGGTEWLGLQ